MYGNKTMLANKLKGKLKSIKSQGKEDYDVVINLAIEVKGIIKTLKSGLDHKLGEPLSVGHPILPFIIEHAGIILTRGTRSMTTARRPSRGSEGTAHWRPPWPSGAYR